MRKFIIAAAFIAANGAAMAQPAATPSDFGQEATKQTIADLTQVWVGTRAQMLAAQDTAKKLQAQLEMKDQQIAGKEKEYADLKAKYDALHPHSEPEAPK